jgi:branched-chain amino acid aminotransferase
MKECINKKFILDGKVVDCDQFHVDLINMGTSIYEVIRVMKGRFLFAKDHLKRLQNSAHLAHLDLWYSEDEITRMIHLLPHLNYITDGNIKIVFNYLEGKANHFLIYFVPHRYPEPIDYQNGVNIITFSFTLKDPNKKIWRPDFRARINDMILIENVFEVLLIDEKGSITEASKANFFSILNRTAFTPPITNVLPGITRKYVLEICMKQNIPIIEKAIHKAELKEFDAAFLTGTSTGVLPVAQIDHLKFGVENQVLRTLIREFDKLVEKEKR